MISFTSIGIKYRIRNTINTRKWIRFIIDSEGKKLGNIAFVFCNDGLLGEMNKKYLKHTSFTDIITFDYSVKNILSGDIFISIERVRENAKKFQVLPDEELGRVMSHGILHLAGYKDKTVEDKKIMTVKENFYLSTFPNSQNIGQYSYQ